MDVNPEALAAAVEFLRIRDRSQAEVEGKLAKLGYASDAIDGVINYLKLRRLINDARLASSIISSSKGLGPARIQARFKKISLPEAWMLRISDEHQLLTMRELIAKRRFTSEDRAKAARYFASRGFDEDLIRQAIEAEWGDGDE